MATARERHPQAYVTGEEDPRARKRTVPFEVISAGYSRTGTMTMRAALEILGYPTWHNTTGMLANPPDIDYWNEALLAHYDPPTAATKNIKPFTRREFDQLLGHWAACTDQPACVFTEQLIAAYPEAKVILIERDEDKWYKSFRDTVIEECFNPFIPIAKWLDPVFMKPVCAQTDLQMKYYFNIDEPRQYVFTSNQKAKEQWTENARETYRRHNALVKRVVPKEKLLLYQLEDGWEPLCKFLGKEVPKETPFPRLNETAAVKELVRVYIANSYKRAIWRMAKRIFPIAMVGIAVGCSWWMM